MVIGEIIKNQSEKIIIETKEFKGKPFLDIRLYIENAQCNWIPTPKGVTVAPSKVRELATLLLKAAQAGQQGDKV